MARRRRSLSVFISDEALDGWRTFSRAHGVTVTAVVEVLGQRVGEMDDPAVLNREWRRVVVAARGVDAERRSRSEPN